MEIRVPKVKIKCDCGQENRTISNGPAGGLANPKMSEANRRVIDLVNGLHSIGCVASYSLLEV